jgi:hypothetical protein
MRTDSTIVLPQDGDDDSSTMTDDHSTTTDSMATGSPVGLPHDD